MACAAKERVATVLAIATATPPQVLQQSSYPDYYFRVTGSEHMTALKHKFQQLCEQSGIQTRHMLLTEDFLHANPALCEHEGKSLDVRQKVTCEELPKLGKEAAEKAIATWGQPLSTITHLLFFTSTSVDMPGADVALANLMGLMPSVKRMMFHMQGCSTAGMLLRVAKDVAENNEGSRVLVLCGELGSVATFRGPSPHDTADLVCQSFVADGMAALIVGAQPCLPAETPLFQIHASLSHLIPATHASGHGHVTEAGMSLFFSRDFAHVVSSTIHDMVSNSPQLKHCLNSKDITPDVLNSCFWAFHTGGRKSLDMLEAKLGLKPEKLKSTREILAEKGNMGGTSAIFALDRLRQGFNKSGEGQNQWGFVVGYGPGISIEIVVLKACLAASMI